MTIEEYLSIIKYPGIEWRETHVILVINVRIMIVVMEVLLEIK